MFRSILTPIPTAHIQHPQPHRLPLRRRSRDPRAGIIRWLRILHHRVAVCVGGYLCAEDWGGAGEVLLPAVWGDVDWRGCWGSEWVRVDVDAVLWVGGGIGGGEGKGRENEDEGSGGQEDGGLENAWMNWRCCGIMRLRYQPSANEKKRCRTQRLVPMSLGRHYTTYHDTEVAWQRLGDRHGSSQAVTKCFETAN